MYVLYGVLFLLLIFAVDDEMDLTSIGKADEIDPEREAYYRDDPKKALRKYFDREGNEICNTVDCM